MVRVTRTVIVKSVKIPRKVFRLLAELEGMYRNMVEQLVMYAVRNNIRSFVRLKALKHREMRDVYPQLPPHYVYTACQDASARAKKTTTTHPLETNGMRSVRNIIFKVVLTLGALDYVN